MKRLYVCTECGTRKEFECQENIVKSVVAAFCPVCGDVQVFAMPEQGGEGCPLK